MSEQEMCNIKVIEKQETHFMHMHIFPKPKTFRWLQEDGTACQSQHIIIIFGGY